MAFLKLLFFSSSLMLITALISSSDAYWNCSKDPSSQTVQDVLETYQWIEMNGIYEMHLGFMNLDEGGLFGISTFPLKIWCDTRYMVLNSLSLNITSVSFHSVYYQYDVPVIKEVVNHTGIILLDFWNRKTCSTCSPLKKVLAYGHYQVIITYTVILKHNPSLFVTTYINEENEKTWLLATDFLLNNASGLFPYLFATELHTFKIKVVHPKEYTIFSNVPTSISDVYHTEHTFEIGPIYPFEMAIAIVSTKLIRFYSIGNINMYCRDVFRNDIESFKFANDSINNIIMYHVRKTFRVATKLDYIIIPNAYWHNSMHFRGLSFIRESDLIYKAILDPVIHRCNILRLISSAMTHSSTDYFIEPYGSHKWLREGLAILVGAHIVDEVYAFEGLHMTDLLVVQTQHESLRLDTDLIMNPLASETNNRSDFISRYIKAPFILRTIKQLVYEDSLVYSLTNRFYFYLGDSYRYWRYVKQTITADSWITIDNFSIIDLVDSWITQRHYPVVNVTRDDDDLAMITADYSENEQNVYENKWYIPITYITQNDDEARYITMSSIIWLTPNERMHNISVPISDWIVINVQQAGYYRVYYDETSWFNIIDYLNTKYYWKIDVLNRAQLIDDSFYFMIRRNFPSRLFWEMTQYLSQEHDYIAWYPMFKALEYLSSILAFNFNDIVSDFRIIMSKLFDSFDTHYTRYGNRYLINIYEGTFDADTLHSSLKLEAIKWACIFGSPACLSNATHYLKLYVANSSSLGIKQKHSAEWVAWTFYNGLIEADQETWNNISELKNNYNDIYEKRRLENALTCSNTPNIILNYLQTAIDSDNIEIILSIIVKHANKDVILTEILKKFQLIQLSEINRIALLCGIINNVYTIQQYDKILEYVQNVLSEVLIGTYVKNEFIIIPEYTKEVIENIVQKIYVRQSQSSRIYDKYIEYIEFPDFLMN